jgi:hypothetical protein
MHQQVLVKFANERIEKYRHEAAVERLARARRPAVVRAPRTTQGEAPRSAIANAG